MKAILQFEIEDSVIVDEEFRKFSFIGEGNTQQEAFVDGVRKYFEQHKFETDALGEYDVIPRNGEQLNAWIDLHDLGTIYMSSSFIR